MTMRNRQLPSGEYFLTGSNGSTVRRIRTPHPHDVLCGRGGGINSHEGNRVFRDWVADRRLSYNLASSKSDKARVAKEVMNMVAAQNPPGRFLMRDPTGGIGSWWIEIDEPKAMAKTSQALREGAPSIRAQHQEEVVATAVGTTSGGSARRGRTATKRRHPPREESTPELSPLPSPLLSNALFEESEYGKDKRPRRLESSHEGTDTPTLIPAHHVQEDVPALNLHESSETAPLYKDIFSQTERAWNMDTDTHLQDFVNPFEYEFYDGEISNTCLYCGSLVPHGKECTCLSSFDPLHEV